MAQNAQSGVDGNQAAPKTVKKQSGAAELIALRNRFFYIHYRKLSLIFLGALCLCAFSLISALYFATRKTPPIYVPVTPQGQLVSTYPVNMPSIPDEEVMNATVAQWALDGARKAYTFDYLNYDEQLNEAQSYFTYRGWENYMASFAASQNFNTISQQKMIVKFTPKSVPVIKATQVVAGRLSWSLTFEATVQYFAHEGQNQGFVKNVLVRMVIVRMSTVDSPKGLGIDQFVTEEIQQKK